LYQCLSRVEILSNLQDKFVFDGPWQRRAWLEYWAVKISDILLK
jgi:hypothetical protein